MGPWDLIKEMKMGGSDREGVPGIEEGGNEDVEVRRTEPHQRTAVGKQAVRRLQA